MNGILLLLKLRKQYSVFGGWKKKKEEERYLGGKRI